MIVLGLVIARRCRMLLLAAVRAPLVNILRHWSLHTSQQPVSNPTQVVGTFDMQQFMIDQLLIKRNHGRGTDATSTQTRGGVQNGSIGHQTGIQGHKEVVGRTQFNLYLGIFQYASQRRIGLERLGWVGATKQFEVVIDKGQGRGWVDVPVQIPEHDGFHLRHVEGTERSAR